MGSISIKQDTIKRVQPAGIVVSDISNNYRLRALCVVDDDSAARIVEVPVVVRITNGVFTCEADGEYVRLPMGIARGLVKELLGREVEVQRLTHDSRVDERTLASWRVLTDDQLEH